MERARLYVPAIEGFFGKMVATYQAQIYPGDIPSILGHDPRDWKRMPEELRHMYEEIQRRTNTERREGAMRYIETRMGPHPFMVGAFPAICIGMTQPAVFTRMPSDSLIGDTSMGVLGLTGAAGSTRILLDGLARVSAMLTLLDTMPPTMDVNTWLLLPVTFYAPRVAGETLTAEQLGQLFHDFNYLQARIAQSHAIALDRSDVYVQLTNRLSKEPTIMAHGGMDERRASLTQKSTAIVVQQVLLRFVRIACEGESVLANNKRRILEGALTPATFESYLEKLESFLRMLAKQMGEERFTDRDALHLTSPGWQVLGLVFHELYVKLQATEGVAGMVMERLAHLDWSRSNPDWVPLLGEAEENPDTGERVRDAQGRSRVKITRLGAAGIQTLRQYVYAHTGLKTLLNEQAIKSMALSA